MSSYQEFNPHSSCLPDDAEEYENTRVTSDLADIPGIGSRAEDALKQADVTTSYQLFGKYLMFAAEDCDPNEKLNEWLYDQGIPHGFSDTIVHAIAVRLSSVFPRLYDIDNYPQARKW